eukprot:TRINITY_DN72207_c0_g1_i1.p1 TRINITY_DN72207_c0_g1~~TRINITY_DN72207_c0_g1_i1.p1  ORF type:complete len:219 (-),score=40.36 TRINITY_DN72207_c0_g1_i1:83-739(-)
MNNGPPDKLDFIPDPSTFTSAEDIMNRRIEEDNILEYREEEVREAAHKKLWTQFQQTASALTQLYRDQPSREQSSTAYREQPGSAWQPFQTAAGSLTLLYRESLEEQRRAAEINRKLGYHRARRDILAWARSKRRFIRREELFSFLVQCSPGQSISNSDNSVETDLTFTRQPQALPSLQEMLELSRLEGGERCKRPAPSSPSRDENMDSPSSKRSRFN